MMDNFNPNRALLNPKFEGYKLHPILQEKAVRRYKLPRRPTQATVSTRSPLSFEEMRSRITHNHLSLDSDSGSAVYVDDQYTICLVSIPTSATEEDVIPSFRILYEMPTPMDIASDSTIQKEYPTCAFLGPGTVAVADGSGLLYILPIEDGGGPVEPVGIFTLRTGSVVNSPFRIHYSHKLSPMDAVLLLSSRHYPDTPSQKLKTSHTQIEFDVWAVQVHILSLTANPSQQDFQVLWHRRGQDVPIYATFVQAVNAYLLIGGSSYPDPNAVFSKHYEPAPDEMATIPRADENLDTSSTLDKPEKPYPYSWMQTSDTITVAFPLPSSTSKTSIRVIFTMQTLTVTVNTTQIGGEIHFENPHYVAKALWDNVDPSACFWTWDREAEHAFGLLTLHMEKKNEGTRWMQVFASSAISSREGSDDVEVPESVDPSEMVKIREALEKWTASISSGEDASGLGLGRGVPSLMEGEMDEEADTQVGRTSWLTWIAKDGQTPDWCMRTANTGDQKPEYWEAPPITLLSTPFPGTLSTSGEIELLLKQDLDGTVFSFKTTDHPSPVWEHTSTYPALAFVLASKLDTRFTHHLLKKGVLAFEGGSLRDRGANLYIYRPSGGNVKWAKQSVIQIDDGGGGAVLGVGCINVDGGKEVLIVCLTEKELVLIRGI